MRRLLSACAGLAILAAGCGGDDRLTADEFRDRAQAVCRAAERDVERLGRPSGSSSAAVADYFRRALSVAERRVAEQRELRPPEGLQDEQDRILEIQRQGMDVVRGLVDDLEEGADPREALTGVQDRLQGLESESDRLARRLGLDDCVTEG